MTIAQISRQQEEMLAGLNANKPFINPKFFYDERGSELFAEICEQPEYYPTRTEVSILQECSADIAQAVDDIDSVIEPGAGSCEKIRYLLGDIAPESYIPTDISADYLQQAAAQLRRAFPQVRIEPIAADFNQSFELPNTMGRCLLFYPGSTIGNFTPDQAVIFLERCAHVLGSGGGLLVGVDLHKDSAVLNAAYNDSQGITAEFNRNILNHANQLLDANFQAQSFSHRAFYNERERRIEMYLVSSVNQTIEHALGTLNFSAGDSIHTEYSYKYSPENFLALAASAGFGKRAYWSDTEDLFSVQYFEVL